MLVYVGLFWRMILDDYIFSTPFVFLVNGFGTV